MKKRTWGMLPHKEYAESLERDHDPFDTLTMSAIVDLCGFNCVDALAEATAWQMAKDTGLEEPSSETRRLAWTIAVNHCGED